MADFTQAVLLTLRNEGGYVNNPLDPGGATNMGITQRDMPGVDIRTLSAPLAMNYYREHFWPYGYSAIEHQAFANKLFDMGVLFGLREAVILLQLILSIHADGNFGQFTLSAINAQSGDQLLALYKQRMVSHARNVITAKPSEIIFLQGWLNRINS